MFLFRLARTAIPGPKMNCSNSSSARQCREPENNPYANALAWFAVRPSLGRFPAVFLGRWPPIPEARFLPTIGEQKHSDQSP